MIKQNQPVAAISGGMALCAFIFLLWLRMGIGQDIPGQTIFGDEGDGYFNLWVLEHVRLEAPRGGNALADARIMHPETGTYWFSDNLIMLSPPYILLRGSGFTRIASIYYVHIFWWTASFFAGWWMFIEIRRTLEADTVSGWGAWMAPWLSLALVWLPARLEGLKHFQSHALVFLLLETTFAMLFLRRRSTVSLVGMAACQFALIASAPYYGVLGILVLTAWGLTLCTDPHLDIRRLLLRKMPWVLPWVAACFPIATAYMKHETPVYNHEGLLPRAWQLSDLLPPSMGGRLEAYPGLWMSAAFLLAGCWLVRKHAYLFRQFSWRREGILLVIFALTLLKVKELYALTSFLRLGLQIWMMILLLRNVRHKNKTSSRGKLLLFLAGLFIIGTAKGPGNFYGADALDPSVWGIFSTWVPGIKSMRGLMRIMPAAAFMFAGLLYAMALSQQKGGNLFLWNTGALALLTLALVEPRGQKAPRSSVDPMEINLTESQEGFFSTLQGVLLDVPSAPLHGNPKTMLRWQPYRNIRLINGYSGRSTAQLDEIISVENRHGRASVEQVRIAREAGTDWLVLRRAWVYDEKEKVLASTYPQVYLDERFRVLELRANPPVE